MDRRAATPIPTPYPTITPLPPTRSDPGRGASLVGQAIGPYQVDVLLGEGGMGSVYLARDQVLSRPTALKVLRPDMAAHRDVTDRFFREALMQGQLNHPNIVTIYTAGTHGRFPYMAMEYVPGSDLANVMKTQGRLPLRSALGIIHQISDALATAHESKIIHRDIKPQNILLDDLGRVKLTDFGIARMKGDAVARLTKQGQVLGTPAYMSPEQCAGGDIDERSDVYSLGIVLYQMLAGDVPHRGNTPYDTIHKIITEEAKPIEQLRPDAPRRVCAIVKRAMAKNAGDRYPTIRNFEADIRVCILELDLGGMLS